MNKRVIIIGGIAALCLIGGSAWYFMRGKGGSKSDVAYVTTVGSLNENISGTQNRYAGVVEPQKTVQVKLDSSRAVQRLMVEEGQMVKAGDQLFEYDVSAGEEELATAQLELERMKTEAVSFQEQINTYQREKEKAPQEEQLSYTIQIQSAQMDLKKNEYDQKKKAAEIEKLKKTSDSPIVTSEIDGVIKSIKKDIMKGAEDYSDPDPDSSGGEATFITILGTGNYRVKGKINEQNMGDIVEGTPVIVRSRLDGEVTWRGAMGTVDTDHPDKDEQNSDFAMSGMEDDEQTTSSSYPFYVELETTEGLMLGQHVYIEMDVGQEDQKKGVWLNELYIRDTDTDPYVWASDGQGRLERRKVVLGDYDEAMGEYEITEGLTVDDCIAFPSEHLQEGMTAEVSDQMQIPTEDQKNLEMEQGPEGAQEINDDSGFFPGADGAEDIELPADTDEEADAPSEGVG